MNLNDFQKTLVSSINKDSVNGGAETSSNVDYPVAKLMQQGVDGAFYVVDQAGNILFKVVDTTLTLGTKVVDSGIELGKGVVSATGHVVDTGVNVTRSAILDTSTEAANDIVTGIHNTGKIGVKTVYNGVSDVSTGIYDAGTNIGRTGVDLVGTTVDGIKDVSSKTLSGSKRIISNVAQDSKGVVNNITSNGNKIVTNIAKNTGELANDVIGVTTNLAGKTIDFAVTGVHQVVTGVIRVGGKVFNTVLDLGSDVSGLVINTGQNVLESGINTGKNVINTTVDIGSSGVNTGVQLVNRTGQGVYQLGQTGLNSSKDFVNHGVSGVNDLANTGLNTGTKIINVGKNGLIKSADNISSGVHNIKKDISNTGRNTFNKFKGGEDMSGVSVLNLNNDSSRMLIPSNFLTSKHVYFVRYQPEGTNMYNYKLNMKGGNVNYLKLVDVNPIWTANNFNDSMPDNVLIQGKQILNNLISDLKTTQFGGYVEQRVSDKDDYYNEYKNYKLKYLSLKNNA